MFSTFLIGWVDFALVLLIGWVAVGWLFELRYRHASGDHRPFRIVIGQWLGLLDKDGIVWYKGAVRRPKERSGK